MHGADLIPLAARTSETIADRPAAFFWTGAVLAVLGILSILFSPISTLAAGLMIGALLAIAGTTQIVHAFHCRRVRRIAWHGVLGLIYAASGVIILARPVLGTLSLTLVAAAFLVVEGLARMVVGFMRRDDRGWGWLAGGGLLSVALGVLLYVLLPDAAGVFLGVVIGVHLLVAGIGMMMLARRATLPEAAPEPWTPETAARRGT